MTKLYTIPKIKWKTVLLYQGEIPRAVKFSENTFIEYSIHAEVDGMYSCYYGNGRFRDFKTEEEAKEWVSEVHYPAQVEKYLNLITNQSNNNGWISTDCDLLREYANKEVLIYTKRGDIEKVTYGVDDSPFVDGNGKEHAYSHWFAYDWDFGWEVDEVKYWQPLPQPPKEN